MSYMLASEKYTYNLIQYIHNESENPSLFTDGMGLRGLNPILKYKAKNKSTFNSFRDLHLLSCTGPDLVSKKLRDILEKVAPAEVEFFYAVISFEDTELHDFYAINIVNKLNYCDMQKSEYEVMNFDPKDPRHMFLYTIFLDERPNNLNIIRWREQPTSIVINDKLKRLLKLADYPASPYVAHST